MLLCGNKILRIDLHNPKINYRKSVCVAYSPRLDTLLLEQHFSKFNRYYRITRKEYDSFDSLRTEEMIDKFITEAANNGHLLFSTNPEDNNVIHQKMLEKINEENYSSFSSGDFRKETASDTGYHPDTEEHHSDTATPDRNFSTDSRENRNESGTENGTKGKKDTVSASSAAERFRATSKAGGRASAARRIPTPRSERNSAKRTSRSWLWTG